MRYSVHLRGEAEADGNVSMLSSPDMSRGESAATAIAVPMVREHVAMIQIPGSGTVAMQAAIGDPSVAGSWQELDSVSATGRIWSDEPAQWIRFVVSGHAGDPIVIDYMGQG